MPTPYIYKTLFFSLSPVDIGCVPGSIFNVKKKYFEVESDFLHAS